jgi:hypothetical protein
MIQFKLATAWVKAGNDAQAKSLLIELSALGKEFAKNREIGELLRSMK